MSIKVSLNVSTENETSATNEHRHSETSQQAASVKIMIVMNQQPSQTRVSLSLRVEYSPAAENLTSNAEAPWTVPPRQSTDIN